MAEKSQKFIVPNVGIGTTTPVAKLDVAGTIKVGSTASACDGSLEGQQRYNSSTKLMEFCNGTTWTSMSSYAALLTRICAADLPAGGFTANTWITAAFNSAQYDTLAGADLANNRVVIPSTGMYMLVGQVDFCPQTVHYASAMIKVNGAGVGSFGTSIAEGCRSATPVIFRQLTNGDLITMDLFDSHNGPTYGITNQCLTVLKLN